MSPSNFQLFDGFLPLPPYLCGKFRNSMNSRLVKCLLVAVFGIFFTLFSTPIFGQHGDGDKHQENQVEKKEKKLFDANEVIFGHIMDAHEFHFLSWKDGAGKAII